MEGSDSSRVCLPYRYLLLRIGVPLRPWTLTEGQDQRYGTQPPDKHQENDQQLAEGAQIGRGAQGEPNRPQCGSDLEHGYLQGQALGRHQRDAPATTSKDASASTARVLA